MAKYTTEVRSICEHYAGLKESAGYSSIDSIIEKAAPKIFDFDFPIYDEAYRTVLEKKILRHFYTREIGDETVGLWKLRLETKMNEIMPYYNQLYKSTLYDFNPFYDVDFARSHQTKTDGSTKNNSNQDYNGTIHNEGSSTDNNTRNIDTTGTSKDVGTSHSTSSNTNESTNDSTTNGTDHNTTSTKGTSNSISRYSDTPQGAITNLQNNTYLTNATITDGTTTGNETSDGTHSNTGHSTTNSKGNGESNSNTTENGETTGHSTNVFSDKGTNTADQNSVNNTQYQATGTAKTMEEYIEHVSGKMNAASYSDLLIKFRKTFINIDVMIINELKPLFFELW